MQEENVSVNAGIAAAQARISKNFLIGCGLWLIMNYSLNILKWIMIYLLNTAQI